MSFVNHLVCFQMFILSNHLAQIFTNKHFLPCFAWLVWFDVLPPKCIYLFYLFVDDVQLYKPTCISIHRDLCLCFIFCVYSYIFIWFVPGESLSKFSDAKQLSYLSPFCCCCGRPSMQHFGQFECK